MSIQQLAQQVIAKYDNDQQFKQIVDASPEIYRAMVYESGLTDHIAAVDGTDQYNQFVDVLVDAFGQTRLTS